MSYCIGWGVGIVFLVYSEHLFCFTINLGILILINLKWVLFMLVRNYLSHLSFYRQAVMWKISSNFFFFRAAPVAYGGSQARVKLELQLPAYPIPQPLQCQI